MSRYKANISTTAVSAQPEPLTSPRIDRRRQASSRPLVIEQSQRDESPVCCGEEPPPGFLKQCMRGHALPSLQAVVTGYPPLAKTEHKPRMECTGWPYMLSSK